MKMKMYYATSFVIHQEYRQGRASWGSDNISDVNNLIELYNKQGDKTVPAQVFQNATIFGHKIVAMQIGYYSIHIIYEVQYS